MARRRKANAGCGCLLLILVALACLVGVLPREPPHPDTRTINSSFVEPVGPPPRGGGGSFVYDTSPGKQHVNGYTRKDGIRIRAYNRNRR
jgi:hypothetical protein